MIKNCMTIRGSQISYISPTVNDGEGESFTFIVNGCHLFYDSSDLEIVKEQILYAMKSDTTVDITVEASDENV